MTVSALSDTEITLSARKLTRRFGNQKIIHDVSLTLRRGEVLGLLGHNGAGKSTTMQMLTGCLLPDSGEIDICGTDLLRQPILAKRHLGYLPETPPLYRELRVDDYLIFAARLRGIGRNRPRRLEDDFLPEGPASSGGRDEDVEKPAYLRRQSGSRRLK